MYKKIAIIGIMGSGKSTIANYLGKKLSIQTYHLDKIYFKKNWEKITKEEGEKLQKEIIQKDSWIFDGNWTNTLDIRLEAADTIIFLDYPKWVSLYRVFKRLFKGLNNQPTDKAIGNKEKVNFKLLKSILTYPRQEIYEKINKYKKGKNIFIVRSSKEADLLIKSLPL